MQLANFYFFLIVWEVYLIQILFHQFSYYHSFWESVTPRIRDIVSRVIKILRNSLSLKHRAALSVVNCYCYSFILLQSSLKDLKQGQLYNLTFKILHQLLFLDSGFPSKKMSVNYNYISYNSKRYQFLIFIKSFLAINTKVSNF